MIPLKSDDLWELQGNKREWRVTGEGLLITTLSKDGLKINNTIRLYKDLVNYYLKLSLFSLPFTKIYQSTQNKASNFYLDFYRVDLEVYFTKVLRFLAIDPSREVAKISDISRQPIFVHSVSPFRGKYRALLNC